MSGLTDHVAADEAAHVFAYWSDCLTFLRGLPDDWCHAVVTDPPYGLADHRADVVARAITAWASGDRERVPSGRGFMGREWDAFVPPPAVWDECLRVLKPGGHLAVFAGSRTVDLMGLSIRLAGFELRDGIAAWLYGSGFPHGTDVGKAIDKHAGATREVVGTRPTHYADSDTWGKPNQHVNVKVGTDTLGDFTTDTVANGGRAITAPATDAARAWQGWNTALKPAHEPIIVARKPLGGNVAATVLAHGAGAINVDACRVAHRDEADLAESVGKNQHTRYANPGSNRDSYSGSMPERTDYDGTAGRWPTNVVLAHHPECGPDEAPGPCVPDCQVAALDEQSGTLSPGNRPKVRNTALGIMNDDGWQPQRQEQAGERMGGGGASRFYPTFRYAAKAPKSERPQVDGRGHPTVKPLGLMRWLVRLLVPTESQLGEGGAGLVLDPFAGSGTTLEAARAEGVRAVGVEADEHSVRLIATRLGVEFRESAGDREDGGLVDVDEPLAVPAGDCPPDPVDVLLADALAAGSVAELKLLARGAVAEGLWNDDVRAAFTARRLEIEGAAA